MEFGTGLLSHNFSSSVWESNISGQQCISRLCANALIAKLKLGVRFLDTLQTMSVQVKTTKAVFSFQSTYSQFKNDSQIDRQNHSLAQSLAMKGFLIINGYSFEIDDFWRFCRSLREHIVKTKN